MEFHPSLQRTDSRAIIQLLRRYPLFPHPLLKKTTRKSSKRSLFWILFSLSHGFTEICEKNPNSISHLVSLICSHPDKEICCEAIAALESLSLRSKRLEVVTVLNQLLSDEISSEVAKRIKQALNVSDRVIADSKKKSNFSHPNDALMTLKNCQENSETWQAIQYLKNNVLSFDGLTSIVVELKALLEEFSGACIGVNANQVKLKAINEFLWHCSQNMSYPDFFGAWHSSSFTDDV